MKIFTNEAYKRKLEHEKETQEMMIRKWAETNARIEYAWERIERLEEGIKLLSKRIAELKEGKSE